MNMGKPRLRQGKKENGAKRTFNKKCLKTHRQCSCEWKEYKRPVKILAQQSP